MKSILFLFILLPLITLSQSDTAIIYSGVVNVDRANKSELYSKARGWFNVSFKDMKAVLTISDKDDGELSGNGVINSIWHFKQFGKRDSYPAKIDFLITVWVKDNKYKYEIKNLYAKNTIPNSAASKDFGTLTSSLISPVKWQGIRQKVMDEIWLDLKAETENRIINLIASLKSAMSNKTSSNDF